MRNNKEIQETTDLNLFIDKLQKKDKNLQQIYKLLKIAYIVLIIIYIPFFYSEYIDNGIFTIVKFSSIFLGFFTFLILSAMMQKKQGKQDYSVPTLQLLKNAVKRYRLFSIRDLIGVVGFSLIMIGLAINEERYLAYKEFVKSETTFASYFSDFWNALLQIDITALSKFSTEHAFIILSILFAFAVFLLIVAIVIGYFIWLNKYKPIRNNALALIRELEY